MAKGLRASSLKKNKQALRKKVFAPVVDARTERLSAKLQELAAKPRPEQEQTMDVEVQTGDVEVATNLDQTQGKPADVDNDEMELDSHRVKIKPVKRQNIRTGGQGQTEKKIAKRKAKNSIVFAPLLAKKRRRAKK